MHDILTQQLGVTASGVTPQARFIQDLGIDSLDSVELVMAVEEEFGVEIMDEEAEKIQTVGELLQCVEEKLRNAKRSDR